MVSKIQLNTIFDHELVFENKRVKLTPLVPGDIGSLKTIALEPSLWELTTSSVQTPEDLNRYVESAYSGRLNRESYPFLVYDKKYQTIAGSTRYGAISDSHKRLEIGWTWIIPKLQGTGLNLACKFELLQFAFETFAVNRVEFKTDVLNLRSRQAILKIGAKEEGILRKHQITDSERVRDTVYFSILHTEWPGIKHTVFSEYC